MPVTKSAKKRLRQNEKRRLRNKALKSKVKTLKKKVLALAEAGNREAVEEMLKECFSAMDKAAKKRVFHKNKVARDKSRLHKAINRLFASNDGN